MVVYIANKPCRFGGQSYSIGDKIPTDKILPRRAGSLVRMGVSIESEEAEKAPAKAKPKAKEETPVAEAEPKK